MDQSQYSELTRKLNSRPASREDHCEIPVEGMNKTASGNNQEESNRKRDRADTSDSCSSSDLDAAMEDQDVENGSDMSL